jgi:hypothetical protein
MSDFEERIRQKAHEIWIEEGRPRGREAEHWFKAQEFVRREDFEAAVMVPNPAVEAEDFAGVVNPDPAARQSDEPLAPPPAGSNSAISKTAKPSRRGRGGEARNKGGAAMTAIREATNQAGAAWRSTP